MPTIRPGAETAELTAATGRLLASARKLTDAAVREPSRLRGWTRGHVLTHVAHNADGLVTLLEGCLAGVDRPMYASPSARAAAIAEGAARPTAEHVADLEASATRFAAAFSAVPGDLMAQTVYLGPARLPVPVSDLALLRIREIQIHHVDLGVGFAADDWPRAFAVRTLDQLAPFFRSQRTMPVGALVDQSLDLRWTVADTGPELVGAAAELAAWLVGRSAGPGLAVSDGSPVPTAPDWI